MTVAKSMGGAKIYSYVYKQSVHHKCKGEVRYENHTSSLVYRGMGRAVKELHSVHNKEYSSRLWQCINKQICPLCKKRWP